MGNVFGVITNENGERICELIAVDNMCTFNIDGKSVKDGETFTIQLNYEEGCFYLDDSLDIDK